MAAVKLRDREALPVTCTNAEALPVYNEMLLVFMAVQQSALSLVEAVLKLDPGFILAHCVLVGIQYPRTDHVHQYVGHYVVIRPH